MIDVNNRTKIGEILVEKNLITKDQLDDALREQKSTGEKLGQILVKRGYIKGEVLTSIISVQRGFEAINLMQEQEKIEPSSCNIIPKDFSVKKKVFAFRLDDNTLNVAMIDPLDINVIDDIRLLTGYNVRPYISTGSDIQQAIKVYMSDEYSLKAVEEIINDQDFTIADKIEDRDLVEGNPLVKLANQILLKAVSLRASDIHIEPQEKDCSIRFRIDGILQKIKDVPKTVQRLLISRYKIMGGMDITETRLPQDGRSSINYNDRDIDLRLASIPTVYGENITIRILDKGETNFDIRKIGFDEKELELFSKIISIPYGCIIITGPTGSGKTTTLYASLNKITSPDKKVYTIEDPVEYKFPSIMQIQVNSKIGMNFSRGLRAMLRSDPDIIMVGEIRDIETAKIALESSITGHLVLTTLHTNDAPSSLTRLMEMGAESYMISSAVKCIVAQRLLRRLCPFCKQEMDSSKVPIPDNLKPILEGKKIYQKVGCSRCNNTGYQGRIGIFSILPVTKKIRELILEEMGTAKIKDAGREEGMRTLFESAAEKVAQGVTSLEEMYRVVF